MATVAVPRWDDRRLTAYADYANAEKAAARPCQRIAVGKDIPPRDRGLTTSQAWRALTDTGNERAVKWEPIVLLGEPETIRAAQAWAASVWEFEYLIRDPDVQGAQFTAAYKESIRLRNLFYASARRDLGVQLGELPKPEFPQFHPHE